MHDLIEKFPFNQKFFQVYSHPDCLNHEPGPEHPERPARLQSIYEGCKSIPEGTKVSFSIPNPATREQLELVHDRHYLIALENCCMKMQPFFMSMDNQICLGTYTAVLAAGGSAFALSDTLYDGGSGFALIRPPGHHAGRNISEGFCFINHVPLAIENIRKQQSDARFLVVDFDVHHGNGIDHIYNNCDQIYYFSIHGSPEHIYPNTGKSNESGKGKGAGFTHNVPLQPGTTGDTWLIKFERELLKFKSKISPDYVLVNAGFDAHIEDPFGLMKVEDSHYLGAVKILRKIADTYCQGRIGFFLEGGYSTEVLKRIVPKVICELSSGMSVD